MSDKAQQKAALAAEQAGHAARNGGKAAEALVEEGVEKMGEKVDAKSISFVFGDLGQGFLALSACVYTGAIAFNKFRNVIQR